MQVEGLLVDTYTMGSRKDLFEKPNLLVSQILDYKTTYGIVMGGDSRKLAHCFYSYHQGYKEEIFRRIERSVRTVEVRLRETYMNQWLQTVKEVFNLAETILDCFKFCGFGYSSDVLGFVFRYSLHSTSQVTHLHECLEAFFAIFLN